MSRVEGSTDRRVAAPELAQTLFDALVEAAAERTAEILAARPPERRWAEIKEVAQYLEA